jgi:DMSO/TMAO reductase YedYZ molybdopterin-dependent catalytic subunit
MWWGLLVGLVAAGCGLAVGEFIAGFSRDLHSPVVSVGERVRDNVPKWLREFAIRNFGAEKDKQAAIWTIIIVIAIIAAVVGVFAVRGHKRLGLGFAAVLGILGAWSALASAGAGFGSIFPALLAAATAAGVLLWGAHLAQPRVVPAVNRPRLPKGAPPPVIIDRRRFLMHTGTLGAGALIVVALGRSMQSRFNSQLERAGVRVPAAKVPLPAPPADPALDPDNKGLSSLFTSNERFYRIDTAFDVPAVSLDSWKLNITGMVNTPLSFSFDELSARELFEQDITMSCVSNEVGGGLVGNARWLGCRLDTLLHEAGIQSSADQILGMSVDGFTAGFPVDTLDGRDAMIAIAMNGEALPVEHGFPARIVVPGLYGYVSAVKWLKEIKLTRFDQDEGYWIPRGWSSLGPIKTQSRIDTPKLNIKTGTHAIGGVAWAPTRGIDKVEVQVDDGPWMIATLGPALNQLTWVQWWLKWDATPGRHQIRVRATDGTGQTQTEERADVAPDGATGWHTVTVKVT